MEPPPPGGITVMDEPEETGAPASGRIEARTVARRVDRLIESRYVPATVVVDSHFRIVQFRGRTGFWLDPGPGGASLNLMKMVRESLVVPLRRALDEARTRFTPVIEADCTVEHNGEGRRVSVEVTPFSGAGVQYFLIVFREAPPGPGEVSDPAPAEAARLKLDLAEAQDYVRELVEDHETLSRRLRATESDLANLLAAATVPLVLVDEELRVRRFNGAAGKLLKLSTADIGRPLPQLDFFSALDIETIARGVIETLAAHQEEFEDSGGIRHSLIIRPCSTGAVLALDEIDTLQLAARAEARYRRLFETASDGLLMIDVESGRIIDANRLILEMTGCGRNELVGRLIDEIRLFNGSRPLSKLIAETVTSNVVRSDEVVIACRRGQTLTVELAASRFSDGGKAIVQVNLRDVTQRRGAETSLRESEERFRMFAESVRDYALFQMDLDGRITAWNTGAERLLGYTTEEILGRQATTLFTPEDLATGEAARQLETARRVGRAEDERWHLRKDGTRFFASGVLTRVRDQAGRHIGYAKIMRDVTARQQLNQQLRTSLAEKEVLLKEVHHRVKNNLQVITSLLNLQSERVNDPEAGAMLSEMSSRVRSIAAIHDFVCSSENLTCIDFREYLARLIEELRGFNGNNERIQMIVEGHHATLTLAQAVPAGLLINELLTNAIKHAFPGDRRGTLQVLFSCEGSECRLEVRDDGVGLPPNFNPGKAQSLTMGLQLVYLLTEQLQGKLEIESNQGTRFVVAFPRQVAEEPAWRPDQFSS